MALGEFEMSKTQRSPKTGFLFFLLLQMSLLSKVRPQSSTTVAISGETAQTTSPGTMSSSTSTDQTSSMATSSMATSSMATSSMVTSSMATSASYPTGSTSNILSSVTGNYSTVSAWQVSCPAFVCTTDCYVQFMNATVNPCPPSSNFCEIVKQNTSYSVNCSASCDVSCGNKTLGNCTWKCCNSTSCLNNTLLALTSLLSTTATTTSTTTTTKATVTTIPATNGKKCNSIKCDGTTCYKSTSTLMTCTVGQDYCMLKKTTSGTVESWQAGCSEDCRKMTVCSTSTTACYLECCNATATASCLKLTGEVNMPSSATGGPHSPALLMASLLLFWIVRVFT